jgi:SpoVK/Ycf46/Vps4 family AAA+-type ATPase
LAAVADICINLVGRTAVRAKLRRCAAGAWGFGAKAQRGLGTGALFAGASGIGKTFAAEVLAHEVRLDLYHLDLSQLVNKYIGETERNLRRVFDAAEDSGAILLFDEADSLFGKRGEVDKGTDRYANLEVSYLLQRMEQYRGLAILTTNQRDAIDNAFVRRLRFIVRFPFPDVAERLGMWQSEFPAQAPSRGIDASKLARLKLPGGNIRSIALNAAYLAAESGEPISMRHLLNASRAEFAKIERAISRGRRQRLVTPSGAAVENAAK